MNKAVQQYLIKSVCNLAMVQWKNDTMVQCDNDTMR